MTEPPVDNPAAPVEDAPPGAADADDNPDAAVGGDVDDDDLDDDDPEPGDD